MIEAEPSGPMPHASCHLLCCGSEMQAWDPTAYHVGNSLPPWLHTEHAQHMCIHTHIYLAIDIDSHQLSDIKYKIQNMHM